MSDSATTRTRPPAPAPDANFPLSPAETLLNLLVLLIAPMFLTASGADIRYARLAALDTINAYQARNQADLIAIAQIVAYGLAALGSLGLSMTDDISLSMILRLRGNANACTRSAEQNRRALRESQAQANPSPEPRFGAADAAYEAEALASLAETQKLVADAQAHRQVAEPAPPPAPIAPASAPAPTEQQRQAMWASAMTDVAQEYSASIPICPRRNAPPPRSASPR